MAHSRGPRSVDADPTITDRAECGRPSSRRTTMKSQFRCILFALIAVPAACGGDRSTSATTASSGDKLVGKAAVTPAPMPEAVKPEPIKPESIKPEVMAAPAVPTKYSEAIAQG